MASTAEDPFANPSWIYQNCMQINDDNIDHED